MTTTAAGRAALDLVACAHWGRELTDAIEQLTRAATKPVCDRYAVIGEDIEAHTATEALAVLLAVCARNIAEDREQVYDSEHTSLELAAIDQFRALASIARTITDRAERIARTLQAPYLDNDDEPCL